jgi:hypothetical protein
MEPLVCPLLNIVMNIKTSEKGGSGKMAPQRMQARNKMQSARNIAKSNPRCAYLGNKDLDYPQKSLLRVVAT